MLLLVLVPSAALILPDILLGGIRSIGGRYFTSVSIATILAVAYFLSMKLTHPRSTSQLNWRIVTILLLAGGIVSGLNIIQAETWWNKELSRIQPDIYHVLNESDKPLLIVSGFSPTNLGDVISLSLKLNPGVQVRIYESPDDVEFSGSYTDIFWFPSSTAEVQEISREKGLKVSEVVQYTLWRIDNQNE